MKVLYQSGKYNDQVWSYRSHPVLNERQVSSIDVDYESTLSGVEKAVFTTYIFEDDEWKQYKQVDAVLDNGRAVLRRANYTSSFYGLSGLLPSYGVDTRIFFEMTDNAGNKVSVSEDYPWATCDFDKETPLSMYKNEMYSAIGIRDYTSKGIDGVANTTGYKSFSKGDLIVRNPTSIVVRIPLRVSRYTNPTKGYSTQFGYYDSERQPLSVDKEYVYYDTNRQTIRADGALVGLRIFAGGLCTGAINVGTNFSEDTKPPSIQRADFLFDGTEKYTLNSTLKSYIATKQKELPKGDYEQRTISTIMGWEELSSITVVVEPRNYSQKAMTNFGSETCNISAGESSCEIIYNKPLIELDKTVMQTELGIKVYKEDTSLYGSYTVISRIDLTPPRIEDAELDAKNKITTGKIWNFEGNNKNFYFRIANAFAVATNTETLEELIIPINIERIEDPYFRFEGDLSSLPDGEFEIEILSYDSGGNKTEKTVGILKADNTGPVISINNEALELVDYDVVKGLESISVALTDASEAFVTSVIIEGGPEDDSVKLDWVDMGNGIYSLEYPRLFPVLDESESYKLTVYAKDAFGNKTNKSIRMQYVPANVVSLKAGRLLTSNKLLLTKGDKPLYQIESSTLRGNNGQLLSGTTPVAFTLRSDANFSVNILGKIIAPGETYEWDYDLTSTGGKVYLPVTPAEGGRC